ncbi:MAG TPA: hypothetical protein VGD22_07870 [Sphingobacteriaceae bacterium]
MGAIEWKNGHIRKRLITVSLLVYIGFQVSCTNNTQENTAYGIVENGQSYIKIKGKAALMAHDLSSINGKYIDSIMIPITSFDDRIIKGESIPVQKGNYKYTGTISIKQNRLNVNLFYDNTDFKRKDPLSWNGEYHFQR